MDHREYPFRFLLGGAPSPFKAHLSRQNSCRNSHEQRKWSNATEVRSGHAEGGRNDASLIQRGIIFSKQIKTH